MPSKSFLRILIVVGIGLVILGVAVSLLTASLLPESLRAFWKAEIQGEMTARDLGMLRVTFPAIILWLGSSIGLFFFWRPSRILYLISIVLSLLLTPFSGPYVDAGWGTAFEDAAMIVSGVILALVYFSPLKSLYERPAVVV
jgi:hypothetical protein